jgi:quercetin dioxygenase-like cupin family protein
MSLVFPEPGRSVLVRSTAAEVLAAPTGHIKLLTDSNATGGALSTVEVTLAKGAQGARPHRHDKSAEMFYVLDGNVKVLSGSEIVRARRGDVIVVPPSLPHAFSAEPDSGAALLIVIVPGVERFDYFRKLIRIAEGKEAPESLAEVQELYDTWFLQSPAWDAAQR